jgi:hypothetical protein
MHDTFMNAMRNCQVVELTFCADEDGITRTRRCMPMDFGPGRRMKDKTPRYWFWDCDSPDGAHSLGLLPHQIAKITVVDERFDPGSFITWTPNWIAPRDWGVHS